MDRILESTSYNSPWNGFILRAKLARKMLITDIVLSTVLRYKIPRQSGLTMSLSKLVTRNRAKMAKLFYKVMISWLGPPSVSIKISYGIY